MKDLSIRSSEEEIMDDLSISGEVVDQTLLELDVINRWLGGNQISIRAFRKLAKEADSISIADLGCGAGDVIKPMIKWCRRKNIPVKALGIDANPHIVKFAQDHALDYPEFTFEAVNIFNPDFKVRKFDIIHCCLFTHHFSHDQLIDLFRMFREQSELGVIINDLHRHSLAYYSIYWLTKLFSKSKMVQNDAALSVARGFRKNELESILQSAGISAYTLKWKWAFRWQLIF
jgi:2-polyprenyl-3-methyl-5-hydroxy-6-metoxy-1,4-benzoquinol methylase